jgi:hypothetical protein
VVADHQALEEGYVSDDDLLFAGEDVMMGGTPESEGWYYDEIQEVFDGPVQDLVNQMGEVQRELAAISEADTPSRKSKRRVASVDEHSLDCTERLKAARNLDFASDKGTSRKPTPSFFHFSSEHVIDNLQGVGISLGNSLD